MGSFASNSLERSLTPNLLDSRFDHDSCGVGFVATLRNQPTHEILTQALTALARLAHRGAIAADGKSSDGVGIMTAIPREFLLASAGLSLDPGQPLGVGVVFFPSESSPGQQALEQALAAHEPGRARMASRAHAGRDSGRDRAFQHSRDPPSAGDGQGSRAISSAACIWRASSSSATLKLQESTGYVCSLSSSTLVYKAMCAGRLLAEFYPDLADPAYVTPFAIFHQRYATNVLPSWDRAQPLRTLAHNGEINTVWGNRGRMEARAATIPAECHPILTKNGSDSTSLDEMVELLARNGRSVAEAVRMLLPPAGRQKESAFLRYHADCVEPWDGPAALAFADGHLVGVALDRNGLRPCRFFLTEDALVVAGSEAGLVDLDPERIIHSGRLGPGEMLVADLDAHQLLEDDQLLKEFDRFTGYGNAGGGYSPGAGRLHPGGGRSDPAAAGFWLHPGRCPHGAGPHGQRRQRRGLVHGRRYPAGAPGARAAAGLRLFPPAICPGHQSGHRSGAGIDCHPVAHPSRSLAAHTRHQSADSRAVAGVAVSLSGPDACAAQSGARPGRRDAAGGAGLRLCSVVQSAPGDRRSVRARHRSGARRGGHFAAQRPRASPSREPVLSCFPSPWPWPPGRCITRWCSAGVRTNAGLAVEAGDCRDLHHAAVLFGYGAGAVCPWLALETARNLDPEKGEANMLHAFDLGLAKIMSKMGISVVDSYRGAHLFDALGLDQEVVKLCFEGTPSPISGIGFAELEAALRDQWSAAQEEDSATCAGQCELISRRPRQPRSSRLHRAKPRPCPTTAGFDSAKTIVRSRTAGNRRR